MFVTINGEPRELPAQATVADVLSMLPGVPAGRGVAVAVDGEVVPRGAWDRTSIPEQARIEVLAAIQGG